jgi:hypothetical protein
MAVEILEVEFRHLFGTVDPLVPMMGARVMPGYQGIVVPKETVASLWVVVVESVVHTTGVFSTSYGKEPNPGSIPKGVLGINQNIAILL